MPHVHIDRLGPCGGEENGTKQPEELGPAQVRGEIDRIDRRHGVEHIRPAQNLNESKQADHHKPTQHDGTEEAAQCLCSEALHAEKPQQDDNAGGHDEGPSILIDCLDTLDCRHDGKRRGNQAVGEQKRCRNDDEPKDGRLAQCGR